MKYIVVISLLFAFVSCGNVPSQGTTFCGSYADIDSIRVTIVNTTSNPNYLALIGKIHGFYITCGMEPVTFSADGTVTLPAISDPKDCLGGVLARQNIPYSGVKISYDGNSNTASIKGPGGIQFVMSTNSCSTLDFVRPVIKADPAPSGSYCGSLDNVFKGKITFNSLTSVDIMGTADDDTLNCPNEAITIDNDVISITDISKPSDCVANYLNQFFITASDYAITYNAAEDSIVVKGIKTPITFSFSKCTEYEIHFEVPKAKEIKDLYRVNNVRLNDPEGSYCGAYQNIAVLKATVLSKTEAALNGTLYGSPISCPTEAAQYDAANSSVIFPNIYNKDDCLGSQLASFSIPPQAFVVTYDAKANTLNATILSQAISVILAPCTLTAQATPKGSYCGGIDSIVEVNATVITLQDIQLIGNIGGTIAKCDAETVNFNQQTDKVVFPNVNSDNDCLGNMLRSYSIDPADLSVQYYPTADCIGISLPDLFANFNLTKSC